MKCVENPRAVSHGAAQSAPPRRRTNPGKIARRAGTTILALLFCVGMVLPGLLDDYHRRKAAR